MDRNEFLIELKTGRFAQMVSENLPGEKVSNTRELFNVLKPIFAADKDREKMYCIFFNADQRIIQIDCLAEGTITGCSIYPREILKKVFEYGAVSVIFAHNHPSGNILPSAEDINITKQLFSACYFVNVSLIDHLIIGRNNYYSFRNTGCMEKFKTGILDYMRK